MKSITSLSYYFLVLGFCLLITFSCRGITVQQLTPKELVSVELTGNAGKSFPKSYDNFTVKPLPSQVGFQDSHFIISEPENHLIKIFGKDSLKTVIYSKSLLARDVEILEEYKKKGIVLIASSSLFVPGRIISGVDSDFYVLNLVLSTDKQQRKIKNFYNILQFSIDGSLKRKVTPYDRGNYYDNVIWFDIDEKGHLWVLYNSWVEFYLEGYSSRGLEYTISKTDCQQVLLKYAKSDNIVYECNKIYPFFNGKNLMIMTSKMMIDETLSGKTSSIEQRQTLLFSYVIEDRSIKLLKADIDNQVGYPLLPYQYNHWVMLRKKSENKNIWNYEIYNELGKKTLVWQIVLDGIASSWRSIYLTLDGSLYGIQYVNNKLFLYQWR